MTQLSFPQGTIYPDSITIQDDTTFALAKATVNGENDCSFKGMLIKRQLCFEAKTNLHM